MSPPSLWQLFYLDFLDQLRGVEGRGTFGVIVEKTEDIASFGALALDPAGVGVQFAPGVGAAAGAQGSMASKIMKVAGGGAWDRKAACVSVDESDAVIAENLESVWNEPGGVAEFHGETDSGGEVLPGEELGEFNQASPIEFPKRRELK